ncbi:hypothetical protein B5F07_03985 [Lachnoclostridium sp. An169]|uniref:inositol monophosphatase family protein n=1 Tax=Lachnoclostridium sp. An169 TaxID=1965569 RepID=UPI000B39121E|nr:inositol monophosphatase [Lachnoclostridium sp. An169]OUP85832.1 hypothetical protein B5F07_03985 [Lachnoclostridium sp. An169]HJA65315.1 inositol monophosphatase [Candidatus Mediterraneibacter cottocaccae]
MREQNINYTEIENIIRRAGMQIKEAHLTGDLVSRKAGDANFVTSFDVAVQKFLIRELHKVLPEASFFGEEETEGNTREENPRGYCFFIDPIDGTTNFMFHYNYSCVSVGLAYGGKMRAGWVYNPYVDEMFTGIRGEGAFLNGEKIRMQDLPLEEGIASFGCARYNESDTGMLFDTVEKMFHRCLAVRSGGSAALDLCRTASGSSVVYVEMKLQPYDYAAASVIIEEAGGKIGQMDGSGITLDVPCSILAGTGQAVEQVRDILAQCQREKNAGNGENDGKA